MWRPLSCVVRLITVSAVSQQYVYTSFSRVSYQQRFVDFSCNLSYNSLASLGFIIGIHSLMAQQPFIGPWPLLQFRNLFYTDGRTPWTSDQPVARPLPTHRTTQTQNKRTQTSMLWVEFEPRIPAFERVKTIHALGRAATVIGSSLALLYVNCPLRNNSFFRMGRKHVCLLFKNNFCQVTEMFLKFVFASCATRVYAIVFVSKTNMQTSKFAVSYAGGGWFHSRLPILKNGFREISCSSSRQMMG
jgi:hypothetical protein